MRWHDGMNMDSGNGWLVMVLAMLILLIVALGAVAWIVRGNHQPIQVGPARQPPVRLTPSQILDDRFARGEIDADDYRSRRAALGSP